MLCVHEYLPPRRREIPNFGPIEEFMRKSSDLGSLVVTDD
jgi:hypothetical protein